MIYLEKVSGLAEIKEHTKNPLYLLFYKYSGFLNYFVQWNLPLFFIFLSIKAYVFGGPSSFSFVDLIISHK